MASAYSRAHSEVIRLFPTFVWKAALPLVPYRPLNAAIVAQLESLAPAPEDDPQSRTGILRPPVSALTPYITDLVVVKAEIGTLLVFPAWLPHSMDENQSSARRISVSINVMFPDFAERLAQPPWWDGGSIAT